MVTARVSTKGQLVIPSQLRKALHLEAGDTVSMSLEGKRLIVEPKQPKRARLAMGKFGRPVLVAPKGAPAMTPEHVRTLLDELP
jgi:AbrB family looped-hinge helix DNA binding protein